MIEENKRKRTDEDAEKRQRALERRAKAEAAAAEAKARGLDVERAKLLNTTVAKAEKSAGRKKKYFEWDRFNDEAHHRRHERDVAALDHKLGRSGEAEAPTTTAAAAATAASAQVATSAVITDVSTAVANASTLLDPLGPNAPPPGSTHVPSNKALNRVVDALHAKAEKNAKKKRRTKDDSTEDITYINKRNQQYNKSIAKAYDKYTEEIRANLERGSA